MQREVIISIKGTQQVEHEDGDAIEFVTRGDLDRGGGVYTLSYQESKLTGLAGTKTTLCVEPARVTMLRTGQVNTQMIFQEGQRHLSVYNTPFGALSIGVHTRRLTNELGEDGGRIEIDYSIEIDHAVTGHNTFCIDVKRAAPSVLPS